MIEEMIKDVNLKLDYYLPKADGRLAHIYDAMRYSVLAGGKRIRPILLLLAYDAVGGQDADVYPFACAIEMIHTYSLIHDDLPAMDDDDFRRGIEKSYIEAMHTLSVASGTRGMIGGQVIDIISENEQADEETIDFIHRYKTAALMVAPVDMGAILGGATQEVKRALHDFAINLGLAFQIEDDILDVLSTKEELGKPINSDIKNNKSTYVSIHGVEQAKIKAEQLTNDGIKALDVLGERGDKLKRLALFLTSRTY